VSDLYLFFSTVHIIFISIIFLFSWQFIEVYIKTPYPIWLFCWQKANKIVTKGGGPYWYELSWTMYEQCTRFKKMFEKQKIEKIYIEMRWRRSTRLQKTVLFRHFKAVIFFFSSKIGKVLSRFVWKNLLSFFLREIDSSTESGQGEYHANCQKFWHFLCEIFTLF